MLRPLQRSWWRPRPGVLAWLLWQLSWLYGALAALDRARASPTARGRLPVPVVVVGNVVVGGAGKTPTVIALVQALRARGCTPGVVSRGYGRESDNLRLVGTFDTAADVGDEPLLIARRTGVPVCVGRDRVAAAQALLQAHPGVDVLVADDGLQHHRLPRASEIVVFDERGAGNGLLLPAGPLREPLPRSPPSAAPNRHVLYTAGRASTPLPGHLAQRRLGHAWPLDAWHRGEAARAVELRALQGPRWLAAAGLAAPEKFFAMLEAAGLEIERMPLPDHYAFDALPWPPHTRAVLVTEKDAVKLDPARTATTAVWVLPLDLVLPDTLIDAVLADLPSHRRLP
jgi:tetraacyldisaccharide 4'-kinase